MAATFGAFAYTTTVAQRTTVREVITAATSLPTPPSLSNARRNATCCNLLIAIIVAAAILNQKPIEPTTTYGAETFTAENQKRTVMQSAVEGTSLYHLHRRRIATDRQPLPASRRPHGISHTTALDCKAHTGCCQHGALRNHRCRRDAGADAQLPRDVSRPETPKVLPSSAR